MNNKILDLEVLKGYAATPEDVGFFADVFLRQTRNDMERLRPFCTGGVSREWQDVCHKIKGAASMAGALDLAAICAEGEMLGDASAAQRLDCLSRIERAFEEVGALFLALSSPEKSANSF